MASIQTSSLPANPASVDPDELLTPDETAKILRQKVQTLAAWRSDGRGPSYMKLGRAVLYPRSEITNWMAGQIVKPGAAD